jgi:hypothetical protein
MNELQLPPAPPLPDEVRERVLRTVLAGTRAPRRHLAPLVAAVIAVVATLGLTTTVALSGAGGPAAQQEDLAPHGDPEVTEALGRCVAAVNGSELRGQYPPPAEWRVTAVLPMPNDMMSRGDPGNVLVINESFACHADDTNVSVSMVGGRPAGAVEIAPFGFQIILFNPQRIAVEVGLSGGSTETSAAPVQIISLSPYAPGGWAQRIVVPGSFDGPPPELESPPIQVRDRPRPEPSPKEAQKRMQEAEQSARLRRRGERASPTRRSWTRIPSQVRRRQSSAAWPTRRQRSATPVRAENRSPPQATSTRSSPRRPGSSPRCAATVWSSHS